MDKPPGSSPRNSTTRFSDRVRDYVLYRPHYPREIIPCLTREIGLDPSWAIADIGSGTGISSKLFLENGNRVYAVEPNPPMREEAERQFANSALFNSVNGTAEETSLERSSCDMIVAGQAFHWFERGRARTEFVRILKPNGHVVLVWNERRVEDSQFGRDYQKLLEEYSTDLASVGHKAITFADGVILHEFFAPDGYRKEFFDNYQVFDFDGLKGRLLSSSYIPLDGPRFDEMIAELQRIFDAHQIDGQVRFDYETRLYFGHLSNA